MILHIQGLQTLAQVRAFVTGNEPISFTLEDRHAACGCMVDTRRQFGYGRCKRGDKGVLRQYLLKVTGLSRAQVGCCMALFADGGRIKDRRVRLLCRSCGATRQRTSGLGREQDALIAGVFASKLAPTL